MNIFSALSIIAFVIYLYVGIWAFLNDRKSKLGFKFLLVCISMAVWAFAYAFVYVAKEDHEIWIKLSAVGWCSFSALILHLVLAFLEKKIVNNKLFLALLYLPAIVFFYISVFLFWPDSRPSESIQAFFYVGDFLYNFSYLLLSIVLIFNWGRKSSNIRYKKQARVIVISSAIPFLLDLVIQLLQSYFQRNIFPPSGQIFALIMILGAYVATAKYGLFSISAKDVIDEVLAEMMDMFILVSPEGKIKRVNNQLEKLLGYQKNYLFDKDLKVILDNEKLVDELLSNGVNKTIHSYYDIDFKCSSGDLLPVSITCSNLIDKKIGDVLGIIIVGQDIRLTKKLEMEIAERKEAEEKLLESEERFRSMFYKHTAVMLLIDTHTLTISEANEAACKFYGYSCEEFENKRISELDTMNEAEIQEMMEKINTKCIEYFYSRHRLASGEIRDVEIHAAPIKLTSKHMIFSIVNDITERKKAEERIAFLAYHDCLTGLPNRKYFYERLGQELERAKRKDEVFAVLFIDLDGFKNINDTMGHEAGDYLLCELGKRLEGGIRESDMAARLGGDEFAVLVLDMKSLEDAKVVADKLISSLREHIEKDGKLLSIDASIGISRYPDDGSDADKLINKADNEMYVVKRNKKAKELM